MAHALNKLIMIVIALLLNLLANQNTLDVIPFLCAIICTSLGEISNKKYHDYFLIIPLLCGPFIPYLYCYYPLLLYDGFQRDKRVWWIAGFSVMSIICTYTNVIVLLSVLSCLAIGVIVKGKHIQSMKLLDMYKKQRDSSKERTIFMQEKNQALLLKQDYEVRFATLNERNRIAREIHDNVGHLLSSSLLQIGALSTINQDPQLDHSLLTLKATMDDAMSSVRKSVHDLHEDALNLEIEIHKIIDEFSFAPVAFTYDIDTPLAKDVIYHLLAIIKECLHNVTKHSNGDSVQIILREHPQFYQLCIQDNGIVKEQKTTDGIGLHNIASRVEQYHGYLNINKENGFCVFITLPKEIEK